ncbi:MAG TPA: c-type cytochrome domain-containing protein, partial [Isosphaeraceae bacterium]|nr:c-type cytochrome domain-containing protein [Isosphaeraceae bacterium]
MRQAWPGVRWFGLMLGCALVLGGPAPEAWALRFDGFVANKKSRVYHTTTCAAGKRLSEMNRATLAGLQAAESGGYKPCSLCRPDEPKEIARPGRNSASAPQMAPTDGRVLLVAVALPPAQAQNESTEKLKFSKDIAPILNGNCMGCHNARTKRGEFDLSTFQKMMTGSQSGEVIVPGKPEESLLVELVETRKMPRNANNRPLADSSIEKIRQWVKEGALLDAGVSPTATLDKVAPTAEQLRMEELAKLSPEERDQKLAKVALDRWKQASAVSEPTMTSGKNFLLFGNLPEPRSESTLKTLEEQRLKLGSLLGEENAGVLAGPEKVSVYVFNDSNTYAEFVRAVERREPEENLEAHGNLSTEAPYLAVVDPLAGNPEPEKPKSSARSRKKADEEEFTGPERSLPGIISEVLATSVVQAAGKPPMWLSS